MSTVWRNLVAGHAGRVRADVVSIVVSGPMLQ
jgi:hypothetical protein